MKRKFQASFDGFHIDSDRGVCYGERVLSLPPKELAVLTLLIQRAGELVSKEELIASAWNGSPVSDESIARCISVIKSRLRGTLSGSEASIKTEYGRGYRFVGKVSNSTSYISEESFRALIDASPDFVALKDGAGRWQVVNQAGQTLYGLEGKPWQGKTDTELAEISLPDYRDSFLACVASDEAAWQAGKPSRTMETVHLHDNNVRTFKVVKTPLFHPDGSRNSLVILGHDVTEMLRAVAENTLSAQVFANSREAVVITDADNNILAVNRAFTEVTGYAAGEVIGRNPRILSSGRHSKEFYRAMWHQLETEGVWRGDIQDRRSNGEIYPKWLDISTVRNQDGRLTNYIAIFSDISERKSTEEQLEFLAYHDPLTRLPNRLLLRDRVDQAIAFAMREGVLAAMMFLDLDQFKTINDTLGHAIGDQLLLGVAERLGTCVRDTDTISRLGGDEFVILFTNLHEVDMVTAIAQKILDHLAEPFYIGGHILNTSFSIGIALYPDDAGDFDTLLMLADTAMYYAKDSGRNTYRFYTEQMNIDAMESLHLQSSLRQALEFRDFALHYQPRFDLGSGNLVGVEASIHWNSPELGPIPPAKLIAVAEGSGLMMQIGEWMMHEACRQNREWQDAGYGPFVVAVNLSALQFRCGNIVETIANILDETGLEPGWLELELTESILIHDIERVVEIVRNLKEIGVRLSIDDFGAGHSSLTCLKRLAVDKIKVDHSFIRNLTIDAGDAAIVQSVIRLGQGLKLKTIAEGVETQEQVEWLRNEGCDEAQGHFYSHPLPVGDVAQFLKKVSTGTC